jgi:hypothetical protein
MKSLRSNGHALDLQALYALGADCGGDQADAWLAYRRPGGRAARTPIEIVVRDLRRRLGRPVTLADLDAELRAGLDVEHVPTAMIERQRALERRRIAATPPTLPHGPPPVPASRPPVPQAAPPLADAGRAVAREIPRERPRLVRIGREPAAPPSRLHVQSRPQRRSPRAPSSMEREQRLQARVELLQRRLRAIRRLVTHHLALRAAQAARP